MPFPCRGRGRGRGRRSIPILLPSRQQVPVVRVRFPFLRRTYYARGPRQGHRAPSSRLSIVEPVLLESSAPPPSLLAVAAVVAVLVGRVAARATPGSEASVVAAVVVASAIAATDPPEKGRWCYSRRKRIGDRRGGGVAGEGGGGGGGGGGGDSPPRCTRCRCTEQDSIRTQIETRDCGRRSSTGIGVPVNGNPLPPRRLTSIPRIDRHADLLLALRSPLLAFYSDTEDPSYLPTFSS